MLIIFLAVTTYLTAGYCQAKKRAKKGLTPTRHDGVTCREKQGGRLKLILCSIFFELRQGYTPDPACKTTFLSIAQQTTRTKIWKVALLQVSDARYTRSGSPHNDVVYDANNAPPPIYQPPATRKDNTVPEYTAAPSHSSLNQNISQDRQNAAMSGASPATARTIRSPWISRLLPRK